jgi:hypothetical protein
MGCNSCFAAATEEFQQIFIFSPEKVYMLISTDSLAIEKLSCSGEYTYEKGKPLEISVLIKVDHVQGEVTVQIEVFRKKLWSYERIYSKKVLNAAEDFSEPKEYIVCIPGYETGEFSQEQQLKMRIGVKLNGESVFKESFWKVLES